MYGGVTQNKKFECGLKLKVHVVVAKINHNWITHV
jgi:hypothetical protein